MGNIIALSRHFSGVSLISSTPFDANDFDAPISAVCVAPLPAHSEFQPNNIARQIAINYRNFSYSTKPLSKAPTWSTHRNHAYISMNLEFSVPVEPHHFLTELAQCIADEHRRKHIPYVAARTMVNCHHARLALPAPEATL